MTSETPPGARALASRRNGARSRGPKSPAGKARSARNALRHGLCARKVVLLDHEDPAAFQAFEAALRTELAPRGVLQADLVARIAIAAWRARRSDRIEAALFGRYLGAQAEDPAGDLGAALIRDGYGPRALDTLLRYRGSVQAELFRALGALKMLQAEGPLAHDRDPEAAPRARARETERTRERIAAQGLGPQRKKG